MCPWSECCFCCLLAEPTSLDKKNKKSKKIPLGMLSNQTQRWKFFLIRLMCAWIRSDQIIPILKRLLIIPSPDRSDIWSYHPQTEVTSDHTILHSNQIPDPEILVWEHTMCVVLGLIRGHFRMAPQSGLWSDRSVTTDQTIVRLQRFSDHVFWVAPRHQWATQMVWSEWSRIAHLNLGSRVSLLQ